MNDRANVNAKRLEEKRPGIGSPLGWMPEIVYQVTATDIPRRRYTLSVQPVGIFLLRWISVGRWTHVADTAKNEKGTWDVSLKLEPRTIFEKRHESLLYETVLVRLRLPLLPVKVQPNQELLITLEPKEES